ncbi:hypothetical protein [Novosphingobium humi]|uniref:hypothetical protein n=1 Tax=Novosphingobium humi TaxID=2282397 RepID=UPI0025B27E98|nr:hypothetical protein [Novosphingobium humi]WJS97573.1 hypothetical protein NYQ05_10415 [Novosphingobium humi]
MTERLAAYPDHINVTGQGLAECPKWLGFDLGLDRAGKKFARKMQKDDCHARKALL